MISWWFVPLPGRLGSLLTKNNERGGVDGFAALDKKKGFASVVLGDNTLGDVNVNISGIQQL